MSQSNALWRRVFDTAEHAVTPRLEALVRTEEFSRGAAFALRISAGARSGAAALSLPAVAQPQPARREDVQRLRRQAGAMDRELRRLGLTLEHLSEDEAGARAIEPERTHGELE